VSSLFPPGITHAADLPFHIHDAIAKGLAFTGFDELPSEERPPRSIWLDAEKLKEWFDAVEKRRKEQFGGSDRPAIEDPVDNAAAKDLIVG
jgi:hypothetical protein